jgi:hypothetical protein
LIRGPFDVTGLLVRLDQYHEYPGKKTTTECDLQISQVDKSPNGPTASGAGRSGGNNVMPSFKMMMMGGTGGKGNFDCELPSDSSDDDEDAMEEETELGKKDVTIEEELIAGYVCLRFILSTREEKRIRKPWRCGLIVKLMGRRVGYKALETRLKQMWVRKGVITIIDLNHDYFLVNFTSKEDQYRALTLGPWMIYDHIYFFLFYFMPFLL